MTLGPALAGGLRALNIDVDAATQGKLLSYVALLEKWNRTHNLTAIRAPGRMVTHHLLDSLAVLAHLPRVDSLRLVDVGSGAGLPGIPLALVRPAWRVALVDSNRKKAAFLRQAAAELPLPNIEVVGTRVESYEPDAPFDIAISRAYSELERFVADASRLAPAGRWLAMKGVLPRDELERLPSSVRVVAVPRLEIPGVKEERHLVIMERAPA